MDSLVSSTCSTKSYDNLFKFVLVGPSGSGKSSIIRRFTQGAFSDSFSSTIFVDFSIKTITVAGKVVKLQIWDTAGMERFRTIVSSYYRGCHGIIAVYDITNKKSFIELEKVLTDVSRFADAEIELLVVGNKSDLHEERQVTHEEGEEFAARHFANFIETSAKTAENVETIFESLAEKLIRLNNPGSLVNPNDSIRLENMATQSAEGWACCGGYY